MCLVPFHLHALLEQHQKATLFPSHLISQSFRKEGKTGEQVGDITWQQETPSCMCRQLALWNSPWLPTAPPTHIPGQLYSLRNSYGTVALPQMLLECLVTNSYLMRGHFIDEPEEEQLPPLTPVVSEGTSAPRPPLPDSHLLLLAHSSSSSISCLGPTHSLFTRP